MNSPLGDRADKLTGPRRALLERLLAERRPPAGTDDSPVPVLMRPPSPAQLILLHPSGGELFCYMPLVRALHAGCGVAGFTGDPRDAAVTARDGLTAAAARITKALTRAGLPQSGCLAGWSYGGVLAFEVARQLETATGERPPVVLLDADYAEDVEPLDESTLRRRFVHDVARLAGRDDPAVRSALHDPAAGLADLRRALTSLGVALQFSDDELTGRYAIFRACALALQAYHPPGPYGGPVTLLATSPRGPVEDRWRAVCTGPFEGWDLPGDHYTLFSPPALGQIVATIEQVLAP